jgi:hypothetical protein
MLRAENAQIGTRELIVVPPPVHQRLEGHISCRRRVVPAAARFQRFERLAFILFGVVDAEL